ncbi:MAG: type II toxin-antitoxin system RelE/ParE family toxin [Bdellovibrionaceae bacterium]|nr:type II toxin-antitoxin system RelE/ParE family toxin [Pseudobdellovibrionaceae bacterium]
MLKLEISKRAAKFLQKLDPKQAHQLATKIQSLRSNPEPHDSQQLKGFAPLRRADVGEYRVIYVVAADTVKIALVGKRNDDDIYKQLKRT